ncbi:hypothetical protein LLS1_09610 [Leifsonia sp. LS1]|nr:hypothetical protein LLS1_09610 [Leifsonia sp. LS1]
MLAAAAAAVWPDAEEPEVTPAAGTAATVETAETGALSADTTKAPVSPETAEVTIETAAKPTSTPSGSLRERAS